VFTQCSKCETVFRLSAEVLRAAGGQVRCGRCGEVFNALTRLAEDATAFAAGESPLELETRADAILESVATLRPADELAPAHDEEEADADGVPGVEIAHLQLLEPLLDDAETSMEFTLPPGELDRIFIESRPSLLQRVLVAPLPITIAPLPTTIAPLPITAAPLPTTIAPLAITAAPPPATTAPLTEPPTAQRTAAAPRAPPAPAAPAAPAPPAALPGLEVSDDVRQAMLAVYQKPALPDIEVPRARDLPYGVWLGAAILLAVLLAAQMIHANRDWLATHAPLRSSLRSMYSMVGVAVSTPPNLSAYQLRQWGVTGDPAANGTLRVRASVLNTSAQLQPYPLLRVALANRFGTRIGGRDFEPAEYLGKPTARMLAPGERVDATLDILDPGKDAEGFEIDVCLRGAERKLACAGDAAPRTK
jgi:predicted Zn finger-like uncharacterized protein